MPFEHQEQVSTGDETVPLLPIEIAQIFPEANYMVKFAMENPHLLSLEVKYGNGKRIKSIALRTKPGNDLYYFANIEGLTGVIKERVKNIH